MIQVNELEYAVLVEKALLKSLYILIDNEYSCDESSVLNSNENESSYEFKFFSNKAKRQIDIRYNPARDDMAHHFSIYLSNKQTNEFVFLDTIIKEYNLPYNIKNFLLSSYPGDFGNQLKNFTSFLNRLLEDNFSEIISGEKWDSIAFDWDGYK